MHVGRDVFAAGRVEGIHLQRQIRIRGGHPRISPKAPDNPKEWAEQAQFNSAMGYRAALQLYSKCATPLRKISSTKASTPTPGDNSLATALSRPSISKVDRP